jgi:hypothetical protein
MLLNKKTNKKLCFSPDCVWMVLQSISYSLIAGYYFFFYVLIGAHAVSWYSVIIYNYDVSMELSDRKILLKAMLTAVFSSELRNLLVRIFPIRLNFMYCHHFLIWTTLIWGGKKKKKKKPQQHKIRQTVHQDIHMYTCI